MQVRKVKYDGRAVRVEYARAKDEVEFDEFALVSHDEPRQTFKTALDALAPHVGKLLDVPDAWAKGLAVRGVSFTWKDDVMGAVVTALKRVPRAKAPVVINTPHQAARTAADKNVTYCLDEKFLEALEAVAREAEGYVLGQRAQGALFESDATPGADSPAAEKPEDAGKKPARRGGTGRGKRST